jgi:hypothetical protein
MDKKEAQALLTEELGAYRRRSYADLATSIGEVRSGEIASPAGREYQTEVNVLWDDRPGGSIRVIASIDDGGLRAFAPLTDSFIKAPDGSFVGEA